MTEMKNFKELMSWKEDQVDKGIWDKYPAKLQEYINDCLFWVKHFEDDIRDDSEYIAEYLCRKGELPGYVQERLSDKTEYIHKIKSAVSLYSIMMEEN